MRVTLLIAILLLFAVFLLPGCAQSPHEQLLVGIRICNVAGLPVQRVATYEGARVDVTCYKDSTRRDQCDR